MAILKASYTRSRGKIKASIRYIENRPGKDGQKLTRTLFGLDGRLKRGEADDIIDKARKGTKFYRFVISPDPRKEDKRKDLNLREITEKTILGLGKRMHQKIQFIGAIHSDHSPNRHVHVIALVSKKLSLGDIRFLRGEATEAALFQRREHDLTQGIRTERGVHHTNKTHSHGGGAHAHRQTHSHYLCPVCGLENCQLHQDIDALQLGF